MSHTIIPILIMALGLRTRMVTTVEITKGYGWVSVENLREFIEFVDGSPSGYFDYHDVVKIFQVPDSYQFFWQLEELEIVKCYEDENYYAGSKWAEFCEFVSDKEWKGGSEEV